MDHKSIRCSVFVATSLDGFIAREDGRLDWLDEANAALPPGEDCGYSAFMSTVDAIVMGRNTFDQVHAFGAWPYGDSPVVVLTRRPETLPDGIPEQISVSDESPECLLSRMAGEGRRHLYVDGGTTVQRFLAGGLIDDLTVTLIPVLIGTGRALFGPLPADIRLEHVSTRVFEFGYVQHTYRLVRRH